jgi:hypothetical protein
VTMTVTAALVLFELDPDLRVRDVGRCRST